MGPATRGWRRRVGLFQDDGVVAGVHGQKTTEADARVGMNRLSFLVAGREGDGAGNPGDHRPLGRAEHRGAGAGASGTMAILLDAYRIQAQPISVGMETNLFLPVPGNWDGLPA